MLNKKDAHCGFVTTKFHALIMKNMQTANYKQHINTRPEGRKLFQQAHIIYILVVA